MYAMTPKNRKRKDRQRQNKWWDKAGLWQDGLSMKNSFGQPDIVPALAISNIRNEVLK